MGGLLHLRARLKVSREARGTAREKEKTEDVAWPPSFSWNDGVDFLCILTGLSRRGRGLGIGVFELISKFRHVRLRPSLPAVR